MKIFIIGGEGMLGSSLTKTLLTERWDLISVAKSTLDITNHMQVELELIRQKPDVIINASAYTNVESAESHALNADAVNNLGVRNLARVARKLDALLIHFSTDYVFDGVKKIPYVESDFPKPLNVYGQTKLAGEAAIVEETIKYFVIRTSWLFDENGNNFFTKMLGLLKSKTELNVVNDQVGGPTYVNDLVGVVDAILHRYDSGSDLPWGIYHYAGYPFVSWYEFTSFIKAELPGQNECMVKPVLSAAYPAQAKRPLNSCLDSSEIENLLGVAASNWQLAVKSIFAHKDFA